MERPELILMLPVLLFSLSLHEFCHALAAKMAGDDTAQRLGRLTLNPISHIDPIGTILVPLFCLVQAMFTGAGFFFGWAKPVPVNPMRFKRPWWDVVVSGAGPASNFLLVLLCTLFMKIAVITGFLRGGAFPERAAEIIGVLMIHFIVLNVLLGIFNLMPFPPLDGSHIFYYFFVRPHPHGHYMHKVFAVMQQMGSFAVLILIFAIPEAYNPFRLIFRFSLDLIFRFIMS